MSNKINLVVELQMDFEQLLKAENIPTALVALGGNKIEDILVNFSNNLIADINSYVGNKYHNVTLVGARTQAQKSDDTNADHILNKEDENNVHEEASIDEDSQNDFNEYDEQYIKNQELEEQRVLQQQDDRVQWLINEIFEDVRKIKTGSGAVEQIVVYNDLALYNKLLELNIVDDVVIREQDSENKYMIRYFKNGELKEFFDGDDN